MLCISLGIVRILGSPSAKGLVHVKEDLVHVPPLISGILVLTGPNRKYRKISSFTFFNFILYHVLEQNP